MKKYIITITNIIIYIVIIICLTTFVYSLFNIINWYISNKKNHKIKIQLQDLITTKDLENYEIDFVKLKEKNSDTVAYLKVNNTNINYIVVKGKNNSYYLNHNFNKEYNISGWIFADYKNKFDETDKNIVIYGHDTKDGSMFGSLNNVLNKEWYSNQNNLEILFITEMKEYKYQVFSTYTILPEEYYITTSFNDEYKYENFINTIKLRSNYNYNIKVGKEDKILTLSSCIDNGNRRVVLHAKLIK